MRKYGRIIWLNSFKGYAVIRDQSGADYLWLTDNLSTNKRSKAATEGAGTPVTFLPSNEESPHGMKLALNVLAKRA